MPKFFGGRRSKLPASRPQVPADLAVQCPNPECEEILIRKEWEKDLKVCKKCGYHCLLTASERIALLLDEGSFQPYRFGLHSADPLGFPGYRDKLERYRKATGMDEAVIAGAGEINGAPVAICVTDYHFIRGAMNSVVGETVARTLDEATRARIPAVLVSGSGGGATMEESLLSLMQMAKTAAALEKFDREGLLTICLLTNATMGGVFASWASLGDVLIAEPGAMIGFTGERVAAKVQTERVPENFRTAEFNYEHGMLDLIVQRSQLKETLGRLVLMSSGAPRIRQVDGAGTSARIQEENAA